MNDGMSAFGAIADIPSCTARVRFWGVKRTSQVTTVMSAFDPKRTWASALQMSAYHPKQTPEGERNGN
jgi:hypothetical protein